MLDRRRFLVKLAGGLAVVAAAPAAAIGRRSYARGPKSGKPDGALLAALEQSPYVYVSPLRGDGQESTCHAEVWFGWIDGAVVVTVASDRWKATSIDRGLARARVWVGDYGRWKAADSKTESFREGPSFAARAEKLQDEALLEKLLSQYDEKYPDEMGKWRDRMRKGHAEGSRVLIRYTPA